MELINWMRLEDLLVRSCEAEVQQFGRDHAHEPHFAFCLEFDGVSGGLALGYGTRGSVDAAVAARRIEAGDEPVYYRCLELRAENWEHRSVPPADQDGHWTRAMGLLQPYRATMNEEHPVDLLEFLWLRFEYLAECVVRRLIERDGFRYLHRAPEFIAFAANEHERLEELEERLTKLYPRYSRAAVELVNIARMGELVPDECDGADCPRRGVQSRLIRCTSCQQWLCEACRGRHVHPELFDRRSLFA